jgi:hypothetical protein
VAVSAEVKARIKAHALNDVQQLHALNLQQFAVYLYPEELAPGTTLTTANNKTISVRQAAILVIADLAPKANWGHPVKHSIYAAQTGEFVSSTLDRFPIRQFFSEKQKFEVLHAPRNDEPVRPNRIRRQGWWKRFLKGRWTNRSGGFWARKSESASVGERYAILYSGMSDQRHVNDMEFLYRTLIDVYKFNPKNITVLNYDGNLTCQEGSLTQAKWPGDGTPYRLKVNGRGGAIELQKAIKGIGSQVRSPDLVLIHTNNHGDGATPADPQIVSTLCCYPNWDSLSADDFGGSLTDMKPFGALVVMMEQCHSGGFIDHVLNASRAKVTSFAAACRYDEISYGGPTSDWDEMAYYWIAAQAGRMPDGTALSPSLTPKPSATETFLWAKKKDTCSEHPVYGDRPQGCGEKIHLTPDMAFHAF